MGLRSAPVAHRLDALGGHPRPEALLRKMNAPSRPHPGAPLQRLIPIAVLLLGSLLAAFRLERQETPAEVLENTVAAFEEFLAELPEEQRAKGFFEYDDTGQLARWSNLPEGMFDRTGWRLGDLTPNAQAKLGGILRSVLSEEGFDMVMDNIYCDEALKVRHGRPQPLYGADEFFLSVLGTPSVSEPWILQFGGHHLALQAHFADGRIVLNPMMNGGNPMNYDWPMEPEEAQPVRQMQREIELAFELAGSLTPEQRKRAVLGDTHIDWKFGPQRSAALRPSEEGLPGSELNEEQRRLLLAVLAERVEVLHPAHSAPVLNTLEDQLDQTWFAWWGPLESGSSASYRIQGPRALLEFSPQGSGKSAMGHVHAIYWDPGLER